MNNEFYLDPPHTVHFNITYRCRRSCAYCNLRWMVKQIYKNDSNISRKELDTQAVKDIMNESSDIGVQVFKLLGGEPFLREDIYTLISHGVSLGLGVQVITRSSFSESEAKQLADTGIECVGVSFDSFSVNTNRILHGNSSIVTEMVQSIVNLLKSGVNPSVITVLTKYNEEEYESLVKRLSTMGICCVVPIPLTDKLFTTSKRSQGLKESILPNCARPSFDFAEIYEINQRYSLAWDLPEVDRIYPRVCPSADHAYVCPEGNLMYCAATADLHLGNVHRHGLMGVWHSEKRKSMMRPSRTLYQGTECARCAHFDECNKFGRCYSVCQETPPLFRPEERLCMKVGKL